MAWLIRLCRSAGAIGASENWSTFQDGCTAFNNLWSHQRRGQKICGVAVSSGVGQLRCLEVEHAGGRSTRLMQNCSMRDCSEYTKKNTDCTGV